MKTMKTALALGLLLASGSAMALDNTGTAFSGSRCQGQQGTTLGFNYCMATITGSTTSAQLGKQTIYPSKQVFLVATASGTAISGLVTPTVSLYLGNRVVATTNISVTTAGNVVNLGAVPYFNGLSISTTNPSTISSTNAILYSVIENDK